MRNLISSIIFIMFSAVILAAIYSCKFFDWVLMGKQTEREKAGY